MILLPGTTGSTLVNSPTDWNDTDPVWPKQVDDTLTNCTGDPATCQETALNLLKTQPLYGGGPELGDLSPYSAFRDAFTDGISYLGHDYSFGFTYVNFNDFNSLTSLPDRLMVGFGYDWRQSNTLSASSLSDTIDAINSLYNNDCSIYLVGHSMGGLVARSYIEAPGAKVASNVEKLITLGTPHLGSPLALNAIIGNITGMSSINFGQDIQDLVNDSRFPSSYELLPPDNVTNAYPEYVSDGSTDYPVIQSGPLQDALVKIIQANDANEDGTNFVEAGNFFKSLSYTKSESSGPIYNLVVGIDNSFGEQMTYSFDGSAVTPDATQVGQGDGIVPVTSASFAGSGITGEHIATFTEPDDFGKTVPYHVTLPTDPRVILRVAYWIGVLGTLPRE